MNVLVRKVFDWYFAAHLISCVAYVLSKSTLQLSEDFGDDSDVASLLGVEDSQEESVDIPQEESLRLGSQTATQKEWQTVVSSSAAPRQNRNHVMTTTQKQVILRDRFSVAYRRHTANCNTDHFEIFISLLVAFCGRCKSPGNPKSLETTNDLSAKLMKLLDKVSSVLLFVIRSHQI